MLVSGGLIGCTGLSDGGSTVPGPSSNQTAELTREIQDEVRAQLTAVSYAVPGLPPGTGGLAGCPSGGPGTDPDGDGVPTDLTLVFVNPPCEFSGYRGGSLGVTGQVRVQDPDPSGATAFDLSLTDLAWDFTDP
ncbi:MAG TPA: hypothetical protein VNH46_05215, partial [Gemmatimonadales bacterium]|nr:hypothetical protein [Gemmatimonadales bacterium]